MKILDLNVHFFQDPGIVEEIAQLKPHDVYCLQEVLWSAGSETSQGIKIGIKFDDTQYECAVDFTSQRTIHDSLCCQLGLPRGFEFQLKDERGFMFYPSRKNYTPRGNQQVLVLQSQHNPLENWVRESQTIEGTEVHRLAQALGVRYCYFVGTNNPAFGNLIMSRYRFVDLASEKLVAVTKTQWDTRAAQYAQLDTPVPVFVVNTHLDHVEEKNRIAQLRQLQARFRMAENTVLAGDFNSLTQQDYTAEQLGFIAAQRAENSIEAPQFEVTACVQQSMFDAAWFCPQPAIQGCIKPTTRHGTRVDYVFLSRNMRQTLTKYEVLQTQATDHNAISVEVHMGLAAQAE